MPPHGSANNADRHSAARIIQYNDTIAAYNVSHEFEHARHDGFSKRAGLDPS